MTESNTTESPLEAAAGVAGPHATDAFTLLGNETRLAILLALWEAYDPTLDDNAVSFSELYDWVEYDTTANFSYHLEKLEGHFVRKTDDGYELREPGQTIVRAVIAGTGLEETTLAPTKLDMSCHRCGEAPIEMCYQNEALYLTCLECEGFMTAEEFPDGTISRWDFNPAGLARRSPSEILMAGAITDKNQFRQLMEGVCPVCSGAIDSSLRICEEHTPGNGEVCPNCGTRDSARVRYICTVCKLRAGAPVQIEIFDHPAVVSFYYDHNIDMRYDINDDIESLDRKWDIQWEQEHTLVSTNPLRIRVTVPCEGDELQLMLDEGLNVIDVSEKN